MLYYYAFFRLSAPTLEPVKQPRPELPAKWVGFPYMPRHAPAAIPSFDPPPGNANHAAPYTDSGGIMASLKELLGSGEKRTAVIDDACKVLDLEVADKSGVSGLAIKGGYKLVRGIKPGFVREVVDHLLDDFLDALDPIYQEAVEKKQPAGAHLKEDPARVADALLGITDARAEHAKSGAIKKTYRKLRPMAHKHVEAAAPRLAEMLDRHAAAA